MYSTPADSEPSDPRVTLTAAGSIGGGSPGEVWGPDFHLGAGTGFRLPLLGQVAQDTAADWRRQENGRISTGPKPKIRVHGNTQLVTGSAP